MKITSLIGLSLSLSLSLLMILSGSITSWGGPSDLPEISPMVPVKGGCFEMGDDSPTATPDQKPVHQACVKDFQIGKFLVTQKEWKTVMGKIDSQFKGCDACAIDASWDEAWDFINALRVRTEKPYRLPTEAEWEYAARSGGKKETWAGTSDESKLGQYAWFSSNAGRTVHPVGEKLPNGLGLYDMSGNMWEWVMDRYGDSYYQESPKDNPRGPVAGIFRVLRGGSWFSTGAELQATRRHFMPPDLHELYSGFRLLLPAVQK